MTPSDEKEAIQLCQHHQEEGFVWLIHQYYIEAMRIVYLIIRNQDDADDIVQESFVQVWKSIHRFRQQHSFRPWFMHIVVNTLRTHQRTLARHPVVSLEHIDTCDNQTGQSTTDPVAYSEQQEAEQEILQAITMLTPLQREAIILHYYSGYTAPEIAQIVGCRPDAVRRRIHDGVVALERILHQHSSWLTEMYS